MEKTELSSICSNLETNEANNTTVIDGLADGVLEDNKTIRDKMEAAFAKCAGILYLSGCEGQLETECRKIERIGDLRDAIDEYAKALTDLDAALVTEYKSCYPADILEQIPESYVSLSELKLREVRTQQELKYTCLNENMEDSRQEEGNNAAAIEVLKTEFCFKNCAFIIF